MTYVGSITVWFRDFSYVLKAQCEEHGMRAAIVSKKKMASGEIALDAEKDIICGWMRDPYDSSMEDGFAMNLSEDEQYDGRFPHHHLSRLRRLLGNLQGTLRVSKELKSKPRLQRNPAILLGCSFSGFVLQIYPTMVGRGSRAKYVGQDPWLTTDHEMGVFKLRGNQHLSYPRPKL